MTTLFLRLRAGSAWFWMSSLFEDLFSCYNSLALEPKVLLLPQEGAALSRRTHQYLRQRNQVIRRKLYCFYFIVLDPSRSPLYYRARGPNCSNNTVNPTVFSFVKPQACKILQTKPLNHLQDSTCFHSNSSQGLAWAFPTLQPPPPKVCGSPGGPLVTGPRIKLRDGRHLAYEEHGVPKETAKYKVIYAHSFGSCRYDAAVAPLETLEELGAYVVSFDRPGYGESDPDPERTIQTTALDMEELADQLGLGPKFYVMGFSMGGQSVWGCLKYIPNRLAGVALVAPVVNYWWPGFPANLSTEGYNLQLPQDQWALRVAH
uniref:AB hydrolase-1 domain-containing protein n=1 Tax=Nicotiana tabacum TaxID=4097 RepID=A0A1S3YA51_TOBAC